MCGQYPCPPCARQALSITLHLYHSFIRPPATCLIGTCLCIGNSHRWNLSSMESEGLKDIQHGNWPLQPNLPMLTNLPDKLITFSSIWCLPSSLLKMLFKHYISTLPYHCLWQLVSIHPPPSEWKRCPIKSFLAHLRSYPLGLDCSTMAKRLCQSTISKPLMIL